MKRNDKVSDFLVNFIKDNLLKEELNNYFPLYADSLLDLCDYIEINIECSLSQDESKENQ